MAKEPSWLLSRKDPGTADLSRILFALDAEMVPGLAVPFPEQLPQPGRYSRTQHGTARVSGYRLPCEPRSSDGGNPGFRLRTGTVPGD